MTTERDILEVSLARIQVAMRFLDLDQKGSSITIHEDGTCEIIANGNPSGRITMSAAIDRLEVIEDMGCFLKPRERELVTRSIHDMKPGDFVKIGPGNYAEIQSIWGLKEDGSLAKPSQGGFGCHTDKGPVDMYRALSYYKKEDLRP